MATKKRRGDRYPNSGYLKIEDGPLVGGSIQLRTSDNILQISEHVVQEITLEWSDVDVMVPAKTGCFGRKVLQDEHYILSGVRGSVGTGALVGIMGESGSGKTTLLQTLGRQLPSELTSLGSITLNKVEVGERLPASCTFVPQFDDLPSRLTVTEHLMFQASLRLPPEYNLLAKEAKVSNILEELNLSKVRHSQIGSIQDDNRGISGGELKRLSVAQELLVDPSLIILDEPTSGLDTFMSEQLVNSLKHLTLKGRSVLCTIHQPSAETFALFDKLLLMKQGQVVFEGQPGDVMDMLLDAGAAAPTDKNINPADYLLYSLCTERDDVINSLHRKCLVDSLSQSAIPVSGLEYVMISNSRADLRHYSLWREVYVLSVRETRTYFRNRGQFLSKGIELAVVPVLLGLLYWQLDDTFQFVQSKLGLMFLMLFYWNYSCYISAMPVELLDRASYKREIRSNMYRATSWIVSKSLIRVPFETLYTVIFVTIIYWMAGLEGRAENYLVTLLAAWLSAEAAVSFGYLTSVISPSFKVAMALHIPIILPLFITAGLFINAATVPWYLVWCQWISFYYYSYEMMCASQFTSSDPFPGCENGGCPLNTGQQVLSSLAFSSKNMWRLDLPMLLVLILFYRTLALIGVKRRAK